MPKVKKDFLGLYVTAGWWIARPMNGTIFNEGDEVKTHHFGGSTNAGVTIGGNNFTAKGKYEIWTTTGVFEYEFDKMSQKDIRSKTDWYKAHEVNPMIKIHNDDFKLYIRKVILNRLLNT